MTPEQIEAAEPEQTFKVLTLLRARIVPPPPYSPDCGEDCPMCAWETVWRRFADMLDCGAYESAAMMLVPEGWAWCGTANGDAALASPTRDIITANGTTFPLALCAAIARSRLSLTLEGEG